MTAQGAVHRTRNAQGKTDMIGAVVPQFFSTDLETTLAFYRARLGFETQFRYGEPTFYAGAIRDGCSIFFRHVDRLPPLPEEKYDAELLDAYIRAEDIYGLNAEYCGRGIDMLRPLAAMPWGFTEFVVKDVDGRLLCFGQDTELVGQGGSSGPAG